MNKKKKYPKVLLVGRTNVGKSTLFNRLTDEKKSIVFQRDGVTRDYIQEDITWNDKTFTLVDTGGMAFRGHNNDIDNRVQEKVLIQLNEATLIIFVCDSKDGILDEDYNIAKALRKIEKPTLLLVNKVDNKQMEEANFPEFYSLGFDNTIAASGIHGTGIASLLDFITSTIQSCPEKIEITPSYKVAIIGRPNVGKSSLMNLLMRHERSIVSDVAGTTRESITENMYYCNDLIQLTDTAGVRRSRKVNDDLEQLMVKSSLYAIKNADIIIIMIDASEGKIADQELKLLFYAYEQRKMIITVFNKMDLVDEYKRITLDQSIDEYDFIFKKIPQLWTSCLTKKNVGKIFVEIEKIWQRHNQEFNPVHVDEVVRQDLEGKFLFKNTQELRVYRVKPIETSCGPTFILKTNRPEFFGPAQLGCVENILRKHYDLMGCPVTVKARARK